MTAFREALFAAGMLFPGGVDGVYGRSVVFEAIVDGVSHLVGRFGHDLGAEIMRFPPGMSRADFNRSGYLRSFPHLAGSITCFCGDEQDHRALIRSIDDGTTPSAPHAPSDIVLTPAACYPVYPLIASRGPVPAQGLTIDVMSYCFRHEPSPEPTRQQMFRQREYVRLGTQAQVQAFRGDWLDRLPEMMRLLALPYETDVAHDPFFGRAGMILAESQREQRLKFELLIAVNPDAPPTACASFNYHMDHFGTAWNIRDDAGDTVHTACCGFGLERMALALLRHHGLDPDAWPEPVREALRL